MKRNRAKPRKTRAKPPALHDALHEAAHAVVSVRLGLPLASTDIHRREDAAEIMPTAEAMGLPKGTTGVSSGYTCLVDGAAEGWVNALPDPLARANLEAFAAQAAAGIIAERRRGGKDDDLAHRGDLQSIVQIAGILGIGTDLGDQAVFDFVNSAMRRATGILQDNDEVTWKAVTHNLLKWRALSGEDVRQIVKAVDGRTPGEVEAGLIPVLSR